MEIKTGVAYLVSNGWRTWTSLSTFDIDESADGEPFEILLVEPAFEFKAP